MFGKRGSAWGAIAWIIVILLVIFPTILYVVDPSGPVNVERLPDAVSNTVDVISRVAGPIIDLVYFAVAPSGQPENVQAVAFSIFLLLTLIGTTSLKPFLKAPFMAFFVSVIIGAIAARSLTATILEESALAAGPLAVVSLLVAFIPIFALSKNIDSWGFSQTAKMVVFTIVGVIYWFFFALVFEAQTLGLIYGIGVLALGAGQIVVPYFKKSARERKSMSLGRYMAGVESTIETARGMQTGAAEE
jgi:hypothetical protein